ncbi:MAG: ABC transporter substrate-binding protein [Brumimicrobium sp.]|nr:ABC transporter substrate-binding protein [Brumimicrobium sp.]MCO5267577.1 ABC transporter substrate-binding protein [Brumimicrobium sp.]
MTKKLRHLSNLYSMSCMRYLLLFTLGCFLFACSGGGQKFKFEGGTFHYAMDNEPTTFLPRDVTDLYSATLLSQVYQGLVAFNPQTMEPEPCLAKSWTVSEDQKTFRFELRDDVYFHTNEYFKKPVKLTMDDVVYSVEAACTKRDGKESFAFATLYKGMLKGAIEFFNGETEHISGLKVNGNTIEFELLESSPNFVDKLAMVNASIVSKKAAEEDLELEPIGTGPFKFVGSFDKDGRTEIALVRNENYYEKDKDGNRLPYLDSVIFLVESRKLIQLEMFEEGSIELIDGLPPSRISSLLGEGKIQEFNSTPPNLILDRKPLLGTQYYCFNMLKKEFKDVRVRQAINYAINRDEIVENILNNQAYSTGDGGVVPPAAFKGYNAKDVKEHAYTFQPEKAKKLLAQAGYPDGKGFPTISLKFNIGTHHSAVADEVAKQLKKVLNINVNLDGIEFKEMLQDQYYSRGDIFRTSWYADYYSPESFLLNAYGKTVPLDPSTPSITNISRYQNPKYDELFEKGMQANSIVDRYKYFSEAESVLMDDSPFVILWYEETIKIVYSKVRNLYLNKMNTYSFKKVYFKDWTKEEWETENDYK